MNTVHRWFPWTLGHAKHSTNPVVSNVGCMAESPKELKKKILLPGFHSQRQNRWPRASTGLCKCSPGESTGSHGREPLVWLCSVGRCLRGMSCLGGCGESHPDPWMKLHHYSRKQGWKWPYQKESGTVGTRPDRPQSQGDWHLSPRAREHVLLPWRKWICLITATVWDVVSLPPDLASGRKWLSEVLASVTSPLLGPLGI